MRILRLSERLDILKERSGKAQYVRKVVFLK